MATKDGDERWRRNHSTPSILVCTVQPGNHEAVASCALGLVQRVVGCNERELLIRGAVATLQLSDTETAVNHEAYLGMVDLKAADRTMQRHKPILHLGRVDAD